MQMWFFILCNIFFYILFYLYTMRVLLSFFPYRPLNFIIFYYYYF